MLRHDAGVPDDFDYIWLNEFVGDAPSWSEDDLQTARFHQANQRRALDETHPQDQRVRKNLQQVVISLEQAIERYGG